MIYIYILKLESNKYYIGKTTNPKFRISSHFNSSGSVWTNKYKPISIYKLIPDCDDFDEDKYTLKYMNQFGIDNVRGGTFCQLLLPNDTINNINKMITSSTDKCFTCGLSGHFSKNCNQNNTTFNCKFCNKEFTSKKGSTYHENIFCKLNPQKKYLKKLKCLRCNRNNHTTNNCYATTYINGNLIDEYINNDEYNDEYNNNNDEYNNNEYISNNESDVKNNNTLINKLSSCFNYLQSWF